MTVNQKGFTLIELIVTMAVFIIVIIISTDAFNLIITQSKKLSQSEESNIEGAIGLEAFRHDLQQGGFGLPYEFPTPAPQYAEAASVPASNYNDATTGVPRPFTSGNNLAGVSETSSGSTYNILDGSDYMVIRGSSVGRSNTSQRWTYLRYSSTSPRPHTWPSSVENIKNSAWVVVLRRAFANGQYTNQLVVDSSQAVSISFTVLTIVISGCRSTVPIILFRDLRLPEACRRPVLPVLVTFTKQHLIKVTAI
jgi:prepilin-type N-terminal cleavage/methylation domain-containing protein